jgi:hypothetical protein
VSYENATLAEMERVSLSLGLLSKVKIKLSKTRPCGSYSFHCRLTLMVTAGRNQWNSAICSSFSSSLSLAELF